MQWRLHLERRCVLLLETQRLKKEELPCGTGYILDGTLTDTVTGPAVTDRTLARGAISAGLSPRLDARHSSTVSNSEKRDL